MLSSDRTVEWLRDRVATATATLSLNAAEHWQENRALGAEIPDGWAVIYSGPSLGGDDWEPKEDLIVFLDTRMAKTYNGSCHCVASRLILTSTTCAAVAC